MQRINSDEILAREERLYNLLEDLSGQLEKHKYV